MKLFPCLLLICVATLPGCGKKSVYSSTDGWIRFKSPDGPYSVLMPSKPESKEQNAPEGSFVMHMSEMDGDHGVMTWCMDLPADFQVSDKKVVANALDEFTQLTAKIFEGEIADKKNLIIDRIYPSRDATIKVKHEGRAMIARVRLVLTPKKTDFSRYHCRRIRKYGACHQKMSGLHQNRISQRLKQLFLRNSKRELDTGQA